MFWLVTKLEIGGLEGHLKEDLAHIIRQLAGKLKFNFILVSVMNWVIKYHLFFGKGVDWLFILMLQI